MSIWRTVLFGPERPVEERSVEAVNDIGAAFQAVIDAATQQKDYTIPAVYRSAQLLADTVASLPLREVDKQGLWVPESPKLLTEPDPSQSYHDTMHQIVQSLVFDGNSYLVPTSYDRNGNPSSAIVAHPQEVNITWDAKQVYRIYTWRDTFMEEGRDIFHIAINRYPGALKGVSPLTAARLTISGVKAEGNFARRLMEDNATPQGALKIAQMISKVEAQEILDQWEDTHGGRKRVAVLGGGTEWVPMTINPVDAQFLETRNFSVQEIARIFGIPPVFLGVSGGDSLTYSTTESMNRMFINTTLNPTYLERIQQTFTRMLPRGRSCRFDTSELLRPDLKARYDAHAVGLSAGFLTVDEVRQIEGLPERNLPQPAPKEIPQGEQ